jgi:sulfur-carrier protein
VSVVCFGAMRSYLPEMSSGNRADVELPDGSSVADLIDAMGAPRELVFSVLVDGTQAPHDHTLANRAEVTLMPPFAGGAQALYSDSSISRVSRPASAFSTISLKSRPTSAASASSIDARVVGERGSNSTQQSW